MTHERDMLEAAAVQAIYRAHPSPCAIKAREWQRAVAISLKSTGFDVEWEVPVPLNLPGRTSGRLDLVARAPGFVAAIELDHSIPRARSLVKLSNFECDSRLAAVRCPECCVRRVSGSPIGAVVASRAAS